MSHFVGWIIIAVVHKLESILAFDGVAVLGQAGSLNTASRGTFAERIFIALYDASRER